MRCLIDSDIISYQCAFAGQYKDENTGEIIVRDFSDVADKIQQTVREITEECMSDQPPLMFLTGDKKLSALKNRKPKWSEWEQVDYKPTFRYELAKTKPYKGQRLHDKPFHFDNVRAYIVSEYETVISDGLEADDMLAIYQKDDTIICSLDKDLMQVPGKHYSWAVGSRPAMPVIDVSTVGEMELIGKPPKLKMSGLKALFAQAMMGDGVDNIRGIEKFGKVKAYNLISSLDNELDMFVAVALQYKEHYPDNWEELLKEHMNLVYMIRELDADGAPVKYKPPKGWREKLDEAEGRIDKV